MTPEIFKELVAQAQLGPSVHNTQPARWRFAEGNVELLAETQANLPAADPDGQDLSLSLGAALEGFALAASTRGLSLDALETKPDDTASLRGIARFAVKPTASEDPLARFVETRKSWRGSFTESTAADAQNAQALAAEDCTVIVGADQLKKTASLVDTASFGFLRQPAFRQELLSWMRLRQSNPRWAKDGMNADAMQLGRLERLGAGFVMGPGFSALDAIGLAKPLLADAAKTKSATAVILFHRPREEDPFESGRAFYRAWLRIEAAGFSACVLAALADDKAAALSVCNEQRVPGERTLVSAFRFGRPTTHRPWARARLPLTECLA